MMDKDKESASRICGKLAPCVVAQPSDNTYIRGNVIEWKRRRQDTGHRTDQVCKIGHKRTNTFLTLPLALMDVLCDMYE
jgi:hypothetical protein